MCNNRAAQPGEQAVVATRLRHTRALIRGAGKAAEMVRLTAADEVLATAHRHGTVGIVEGVEIRSWESRCRRHAAPSGNDILAHNLPGAGLRGRCWRIQL